MSQASCIFHLPGADPPNVLIHTPSLNFSLHSTILRGFSKWFSASMSEVWWKEVATSEVGGRLQYRYELSYDKDGLSTLLPDNQQDSKHESNTEGTPSSEEVEKLCAAFHTMFKCFYRQPITVRTLEECTALISLADQYDALPSVTDSIRASFFEWPELDVQIKNNPTPFLKLGYSMQSVRVFNEAFIHVVGLFCGRPGELYTWAQDSSIPESVTRVVSAECRKLEQMATGALKKLLILSPEHRARWAVAGVVADEVALAILKRKLSASCFETVGHEGAFFRGILHSNYDITKADIERLDSDVLFVNVVTASRLFADQIKTIVSGLAKSNLRLNEQMMYLTCAELSDEDFPWAV